MVKFRVGVWSSLWNDTVTIRLETCDWHNKQVMWVWTKAAGCGVYIYQFRHIFRYIPVGFVGEDQHLENDHQSGSSQCKDFFMWSYLLVCVIRYSAVFWIIDQSGVNWVIQLPIERCTILLFDEGIELKIKWYFQWDKCFNLGPYMFVIKMIGIGRSLNWITQSQNNWLELKINVHLPKFTR